MNGIARANKIRNPPWATLKTDALIGPIESASPGYRSITDLVELPSTIRPSWRGIFIGVVGFECFDPISELSCFLKLKSFRGVAHLCFELLNQ